MTDFTTRVVLHGNATWTEYDKLHKAMASLGFSDEIASDDGRIWKMPDAEYTISGVLTLAQVHTKAKAAADSVRADNSVFVTQATARLWSGLQLLRQAKRA